jgi:hypothetical protein
MSSRPLIIATLLGASVGVPYLASHSATGPNGPGNLQPVPGNLSAQPATATTLPVVAPPLNTVSQVAGTPIYANAAPLGGTRFTSVDQVLRFDVTKEWVYQNWDRKSTGPTDVGLFSVRVPLAMAPQLGALAGSLTYYFISQGQVEHISFRGRTGDSTQLADLLIRSYHFERIPAPTGEQLYQVHHGGLIQSELRNYPEPILRSNSPNQSIAIELELARPGSQRVLPPRPTGFEIPQTAATSAAEISSQTAIATEKTNPGSDSQSGSYFSKVRHATPKEESQVLWKRWPN